jgi:hypothetical protein
MRPKSDSKRPDIEEEVDTPRIIERMEEYASVIRTAKMVRFFNLN